ncbi:MAG: GNAT family N-acetyltransferase [Methyloligellaceae bacterium]
MVPQPKVYYDLNISTISQVDYEEMAVLYCHSIKNNPRGFIQDLTFHGPVEAMAESFIKAGGDMLSLRYNGSLIGMGGLRKVNNNRAELCKLHIHSEFQGNGYGKLLTQTLIERASELSYNEIELHVTKTQKSAIGLYRKLGFKETKQAIYQTKINGQKLSFDTLYMILKLPGRLS